MYPVNSSSSSIGNSTSFNEPPATRRRITESDGEDEKEALSPERSSLEDQNKSINSISQQTFQISGKENLEGKVVNAKEPTQKDIQRIIKSRNNCIHLKQYSSVVINCQELERLYEKLGVRNEERARNLVKLGEALTSLGRHGEAVEARKKAESIYDALRIQSVERAYNLAFMGRALTRVDRHNEALDATLSAQTIYSKLEIESKTKADNLAYLGMAIIRGSRNTVALGEYEIPFTALCRYVYSDFTQAESIYDKVRILYKLAFRYFCDAKIIYDKLRIRSVERANSLAFSGVAVFYGYNDDGNDDKISALKLIDEAESLYDELRIRSVERAINLANWAGAIYRTDKEKWYSNDTHTVYKGKLLPYEVLFKIALVMCKEAESIYEELEVKSKCRAQNLGNYGYYLSRLGSDGEAVEAREKAESIYEELEVKSEYQAINLRFLLGYYDPKEARTINLALLGRALTCLKRHDDAVKARKKAESFYEKLGILSKKRADNLTFLGEALTLLGRHVEAVVARKKAESIYDKRDIELYNRYQNEDSIYDELVILNEFRFENLMFLGQALTLLGRHDEAVQARKRVEFLYDRFGYEDFKERAHNLAFLGQALTLLGRHVEAVDARKKAEFIYEESRYDHGIEDCKQRADNLAFLEQALTTLGRHEEAKETRKKAKEVEDELEYDWN